MPSVCDGHFKCTPQSQRRTVGRWATALIAGLVRASVDAWPHSAPLARLADPP